MAERQRLDQALEARGLLPSRARARDAILRGTVSVNGAPAKKPNQPVGPDDRIELADPAAAYVSRSALKLIAGLDATQWSPEGLVCLDLGASTGGFTQVLIERSAGHVYAVDVGHNQLHPRLREEPAVTVMEGVNARDLTVDEIAEPIDLIVCDISFVSLTKVLSAPLRLCRPDARALLLIKPQFEVGRERIGKGGIVSDPSARAAAIADVIAFMAGEGWRHVVSVESPISGGDGNLETIAAFTRAQA